MRWFLLFIFTLLTGCKDHPETPAPDKKDQWPKVLVFYKTAGFYHGSIPAGLKALQTLGTANHFHVDTSRNASVFNAAQLTQYKAVIFLNTTGNVLNPQQQTAFEQYIKSGNGFVGIHAAADTEYDWSWYSRLVGAAFSSHPPVQKANIHITDKQHPATAALPETWERTDEWYNFKEINPQISVLATLDEDTYTGGTHGAHHPIAWYHAYEGGRAFYTGGGHTNESYQEPLFLKHLLGGIRYAIGE